MLYEDTRRDLAFLKVSSDLPAIEVAPSYAFTKGEDITVIGNPGLGDEVVLQNAISRGVMSSKTVIDGMNFLQLSMAINPGNSGGPVFDSAGRVIGVATLKATKAEALAFCIPVDDLQAALTRVGPARPDLVSRHRAEAAFRLLTVAGAIYGIGLDIRAGLLRKAPPSGTIDLLPNEPIKKLDEIMTRAGREAVLTGRRRDPGDQGRRRAGPGDAQPLPGPLGQLQRHEGSLRQHATTGRPIRVAGP